MNDNIEGKTIHLFNFYENKIQNVYFVFETTGE